MEFNWCCSGEVGMKQQSCWGVVWFFKRPQGPLEKQRSRQHDIWCLITNIWENRVAIGSSVITRCLILANIGQWSPFSLQICLFSVHQLIIFVATFSCIVHQFIHLSLFDSVLFCSIWFCSIIQCSIIHLFSVSFSVLILELYSRYFDPFKNNHLASQ
jgi:hypothetical protein